MTSTTYYTSTVKSDIQPHGSTARPYAFVTYGVSSSSKVHRNHKNVPSNYVLNALYNYRDSGSIDRLIAAMCHHTKDLELKSSAEDKKLPPRLASKKKVTYEPFLPFADERKADDHSKIFIKALYSTLEAFGESNPDTLKVIDINTDYIFHTGLATHDYVSPTINIKQMHATLLYHISNKTIKKSTGKYALSLLNRVAQHSDAPSYNQLFINVRRRGFPSFYYPGIARIKANVNGQDAVWSFHDLVVCNGCKAVSGPNAPRSIVTFLEASPSNSNQSGKLSEMFSQRLDSNAIIDTMLQKHGQKLDMVGFIVKINGVKVPYMILLFNNNVYVFNDCSKLIAAKAAGRQMKLSPLIHVRGLDKCCSPLKSILSSCPPANKCIGCIRSTEAFADQLNALGLPEVILPCSLKQSVLKYTGRQLSEAMVHVANNLEYLVEHIYGKVGNISDSADVKSKMLNAIEEYLETMHTRDGSLAGGILLTFLNYCFPELQLMSRFGSGVLLMDVAKHVRKKFGNIVNYTKTTTNLLNSFDCYSNLNPKGTEAQKTISWFKQLITAKKNGMKPSSIMPPEALKPIKDTEMIALQTGFNNVMLWLGRRLSGAVIDKGFNYGNPLIPKMLQFDEKVFIGTLSMLDASVALEMAIGLLCPLVCVRNKYLNDDESGPQHPIFSIVVVKQGLGPQQYATMPDRQSWSDRNNQYTQYLEDVHTCTISQRAELGITFKPSDVCSSYPQARINTICEGSVIKDVDESARFDNAEALELLTSALSDVW